MSKLIIEKQDLRVRTKPWQQAMAKLSLRFHADRVEWAETIPLECLGRWTYLMDYYKAFASGVQLIRLSETFGFKSWTMQPLPKLRCDIFSRGDSSIFNCFLVVDPVVDLCSEVLP